MHSIVSVYSSGKMWNFLEWRNIFSAAVQFFNNTMRSSLECYAKTLCIWKWWKLLTLEARELAFATHLHTLLQRELSENFHEENLQASHAWKALSFQLSSSFVWWCFFLPSSSFPRALFSFSIWTSWREGQVGGMQCHWMCSEWWKWKCNFCAQQRAFFPVKNYFLFLPPHNNSQLPHPLISHYPPRSLIAFSPSIISPFARYIWQCKLHNFLNFDKLQHYSAERAGTIELGRALWLKENARVNHLFEQTVQWSNLWNFQILSQPERSKRRISKFLLLILPLHFMMNDLCK